MILNQYLAIRFHSTCKYHQQRNRTVVLTFDEYIGIIGKRRLRALERKFLDCMRDKKPFRHSYVLTWISNQAMHDGLVSKDTMHWTTREVSKRIGMIKGQKHTEQAKAKISRKMQGPRKPHTKERCEAISAGMTGRVISDETKAKRAATWAAKKLAGWVKPAPKPKPEPVQFTETAKPTVVYTGDSLNSQSQNKVQKKETDAERRRRYDLEENHRRVEKLLDHLHFRTRNSVIRVSDKRTPLEKHLDLFIEIFGNDPKEHMLVKDARFIEWRQTFVELKANN